MEVGVFQFQYCLFFFLLYDVVISTHGKGKDQQPQDKTTRVQEAIEWKWEYSNSNTVCFSFFYMML
jgi:hypothetical protein